MCTHACVGQMLSADAPLNPSPPSFLSLPLNPEHICLLEELANELLESTWARLPSLGSQTCLLSGVDYLNSGLHVFMADALLTDLSPWTHTF